MSLVAYGNSDSETSSESEDETPFVTPVQPSHKTPTVSAEQATPAADPASGVNDIEDEDDGFSLPTESSGLKLPPPKSGAESLPHSTTISKDLEETTSLLSKLPAPRTTEATGSSGFTPSVPLSAFGDDELEDLVKPKPAQKPEPLRAEKNKKARKKVVITLPSLSQFDSDDEDENVATVKPRPSTGLSGLMSLLPAPKNTTHKETNRSLLPHTLTKKPPVAKTQGKPTAAAKRNHTAGTATSSSVATSRSANHTVLQKSVSSTANSSLPGSLSAYQGTSDDSDDDGSQQAEGSSFFSLSASSSGSRQTAPLPAPLLHQPGVSTTSIHGGHQPTDQPLTFNKTVGPALSMPTPTAVAPEMSNEHLDADHDEMDYDTPLYPQMQTSGQTDSGSDTGLLGMSEAELTRLTGRRKNNDISLIDISAEQQTTQDELIKQISQEPDSRGSYSKKRRKDMPTGQQKRKHQITYLAFEAKEREMTLKNQWAEGRAKQQQARNKYGF